MTQLDLTNPDSLVAGNVKATMRDAGATSGDLWMVPRKQLHIDPNFNVRQKGPEHKAHIDWLAKSIAAEGFHRDKPIVGYVAQAGKKPIIIVTDGHCRLEAVDLAIERGAEIDKVPVVVKPQGTSVEDITVALVTSNSGKPLAPYEIGVVCKRLTSFGMEKNEIARRLGITGKYVDDLLALVGAPRAVREMVIKGKVSATQAIKELRANADEAPDRLKAGLEKAEAEGKDRVTNKHLPPKKGSKSAEPASPKKGSKSADTTGTTDRSKTPLNGEIVDGVAVVRIGVKALCHAVAQGPIFAKADAAGRPLDIQDATSFAAEVVRALLTEREDGSGPFYDALDAAAESAIEAGSLFVVEAPPAPAPAGKASKKTAAADDDDLDLPPGLDRRAEAKPKSKKGAADDLLG